MNSENGEARSRRNAIFTRRLCRRLLLLMKRLLSNFSALNAFTTRSPEIVSSRMERIIPCCSCAWLDCFFSLRLIRPIMNPVAGSNTSRNKLKCRTEEYKGEEDDEDIQRIAYQSFQRAHDAPFDLIHVVAHPAHDITFALFGEKSNGQPEDLAVHIIPESCHYPVAQRDHDAERKIEEQVLHQHRRRSP